jgi:hypothetical protein
MRVGTNYDISGTGKILREQLVAYSFADVIDVTPCFPGEAAQQNMVIGKLLSGTGSSMVQEYYCLLWPGQNSKTAFFELSYGQGAGSILDKSQVHISNHDIPGLSLTMRFEAENHLG